MAVLATLPHLLQGLLTSLASGVVGTLWTLGIDHEKCQAQLQPTVADDEIPLSLRT